MPAPSSNSSFEIGQLVTLRADPTKAGAVIQVIPGETEYRYLLFLDNKTSTYYASQLQDKQDEDSLIDAVPLPEFMARLTALQLRQPCLSNLYSLHAARVNFVPYQFRPVLKFIRSDRPRLLIADEVGVGKTIEAGLILRELQARRDIRSVLILCPKPLVSERKWQFEMRRFDEEFAQLDGPTLRHCIDETDKNGDWPDQYAKCIVPFSLFDERLLWGGSGRARRPQLGLMGLDPPPRFDLVIVDEAHHLRNTNTLLHQGVRVFVESAEAVVFLSATPIQLRNDDLYVLLNLLRPDVVLDRDSFAHMAEPNPFINSALEVARAAEEGWQSQAHNALLGAGRTPWGQAMLIARPDYQRLCATLDQTTLAPEERMAFLREAETLHTFAPLINRTRRRDIGNFTTRKAETVEVQFTESQGALHDALLAAQIRILHRAHDPRAIGFLMTTLRRQAASCLYGLAPLIEHILTRRLNDLEVDDAEDDMGDLGEGEMTTLAQDIQDVLEMARNLDRNDPKRDALVGIVRDKQRLENPKILVFSSFRHTLRYLQTHLAGSGARIGLIHGDIPDHERVELRNRFSLESDDPQALDVLLSSEVGCEGLDYQFCDCLVNYDLPWNPMRVEQRIGRIDRYGQRSETVAIYNLVTPGTVDFDIYERCHLRIGVFRQALGGSEEILGRITCELRTVAENLELTEQERQVRLQQIADNEIRLVQEQALLEEEQAGLFGIVLPPQQLEKEVKEATSAWLTPQALQNLVQTYLSATCGGDAHVRGTGPLKTLRLSQEGRNRLLEGYRKLPRHTSPLYREWEKWLKGSSYVLEITFDAACASEKRQAMFITPVHPLAQQASLSQLNVPPFRTAFRVRTSDVSPGAYPFAIYQWHNRGVLEDALLKPVCTTAALTNGFLAFLETAQPVDLGSVCFPDQAVFDDLESVQYALWLEARAAHQAQTRQAAHGRKESLGASHRARMNLLREQYAQVSDERIRRMRDSQMAAAEADFQRRLAEIETAEERGEIATQAIAFGVMLVEGA